MSIKSASKGFILGVALLIGCSSSALNPVDGTFVVPSFKVYADASFTLNHKIDISTALLEWNEKTNNAVQLSVEFVPLLRLKNLIKNTMYLYPVDTEPGILGITTVYSDGYIVIHVSPNINDDEQFTAVIMHEVGHGMGLRHTLTVPAIMHATLETNHVECTDVKELCKLLGCSIDCVTGDELPMSIDPNVSVQPTSTNNFECVLMGDVN